VTIGSGFTPQRTRGGLAVLALEPSYTSRDPGRSLSNRLDEGKIEQLRAWGAGVLADGTTDLRATGKAILLLIEEIERLHVDLWNAKRTQEQKPVPATDDADVQVQASVDRTLRARLSRVRIRS
jgi:hypothetical protein